MKRALLTLVLPALALVALAPTSTARADHSWYAGAGAGFHNDFDCCHIHGRVQGEIGWHFGGDQTGFFLEVDGIFTFGPEYWGFLGGARLGGDISVHHDAHFDVLLRPNGLVGFGARDFDRDGIGPYGMLTLQPAVDVRFVLADGFIALWLRPISFDFHFWWENIDRAHPRDWYVSAAYQLLGGIDFQF